MTVAFPPYGVSAAIASRSSGEASSTSEISRATERGSPALAPSTSSVTSGLERRSTQAFGTRRISASPCPPPPHSAAAPMPPPRRLSSRARCSASRAPLMPIGWPIAMAPPLTFTVLPSRPSSRVEWMPTEANASLISTRSRSSTMMTSLVGAAVGDLRRGPGRDRAVGCEGGAQLREHFRRRVGADALVILDHDRVAAPLGRLDRDDLLVEHAVLLGRRGSLVRLRREGVLLLAGDAELRVVALRRLTHGAVVERAEEPVVGHRIEHLHGAVLVAGAASRQEVRRVGHRLHAAGDHDLELARADELVGKCDGVQP